MSLIPVQLQTFVRDSLNPQNLLASSLSVTDFEKWELFLLKNVSDIKLNLYSANSTSQHNPGFEVTVTINQLIEMSDMVNAYLVKSLPVWRGHMLADQIKKHYLFTCILFDDLLSFLATDHSVAYGLSIIPKFSLPAVKMNLKEIFNCLKTHLAEQAIDAELLELLFAGIYQFINRKDLTVNEEKYIRELIKMLLLETFAESQQLTDLLILKNFNAPEFLLFCVNKWQNRFIEIEGIHEQLGFVLKEKNRLYELSVKKNIKHLPGSPSVYYELDQFLAEKYTFLKQLLKLHRLTLKDGERFKTNTRFLINLPVSQFGLFIRMQIEKGLLVKEHIGEIFSFFATHFYTPNSTYISAESLRKKSTDVEFATARKMKGQLIGMLNWLNTNYNLSNYN